MQNLRQLKNKEKKSLIKKLEEQYGVKELKLNYLFFKNNEGRIFIINKEFRNLDLENINVNSIGLYFCRIEKELRLSVEGSQIIGPFAKKNVLEINEGQTKEWLQGNDIEVLNKDIEETFVILKNKKDFIGSGKFKDGKILNYVPKERRIK